MTDRYDFERRVERLVEYFPKWLRLNNWRLRDCLGSANASTMNQLEADMLRTLVFVGGKYHYIRSESVGYIIIVADDKESFSVEYCRSFTP